MQKYNIRSCIVRSNRTKIFDFCAFTANDLLPPLTFLTVPAPARPAAQMVSLTITPNVNFAEVTPVNVWWQEKQPIPNRYVATSGVSE